MVLPLVKEPAARVGPTGDFGNRTWLGARRAIQLVEPRITIRLQKAGEAGQVRGRAGAGAIGAVEIRGGRRRVTAKWPIVPQINPQPPGPGPAKAWLQHRNGRIV